MTRPRAIIVDFNGTLSRDEPLLDRLFRSVFAGIGVKMSSALYYRELAGRSDPEIVERMLTIAGREVDPVLLDRLLAEKVGRYREAVRLTPTIDADAVAFVRTAAAQVPLGLVSGAVRAEVSASLEAAGLQDAFRVVICGDEVQHGKPDPEGYRMALDAIGAAPALQPGEVVALEDSLPGLAAAAALGLRRVAVAGTVPVTVLSALAEQVVSRLSPALADQLLAG